MTIKDRTLRGVFTPAQAGTAACALVLILAGIVAALNLLSLNTSSGGFAGNGSLAGSAGACLGGALSCALLVLAGGVDAARCILPDPLILSAGITASALAVADGRPEDLGAAALFVIGGWVIGRWVPLGFGDAKLAGALAALLGPAGAGLAVGVGVVGCGVATASAVITLRRPPASAVALGPWIVAAGVGVWLAGWL